MPTTTPSPSDPPSDDQRDTNAPIPFVPPSMHTTTQTPPLPIPAQTNKITPVPLTTSKASRAGHRPKFSATDDLVLVREVAAPKAHVAPNGETKERYEIAASRANATGKLSCSVTWKSVQDRYKRLQTRFDKRDAEEAAMSGIGAEIGEMEELLSSMKEARDDKEKEAVQKRKAVKDKEAEKERLGVVIRDQSVNRRGAREVVPEEGRKSTSGSDDGDEETDTTRKRRRKIGDVLKEGFESEMNDLTAALTKSDQERNRIEEARLQLDRDRFEVEKEEREKVRQERKEEREAHNEMEMQKFRAMLELVGKGAAWNAPSQ